MTAPRIESRLPLPALARILILAASLAGGVGIALAQDSACGAIVEAALQSVEARCGNLERNELCVARPPVSLHYFAPAESTAIDENAGRAWAQALAQVEPGAMDAEAETWGLALLHLGANLPTTYAGPGLLAVVAGPAQLSNAIEPDSVMRIGEPLQTAAIDATPLYRNPGVIPEAIGALEADELLLVDAYDKTGAWLRAVTEGSVAWVESDKVARLQAMHSLPRIGLGETFPFQSLAIATEAKLPACQATEPFIALQSPPGLPISLTINGLDMLLDGMASFQQVHRSALSLTTHRGQARTLLGRTVRQGESALGILQLQADGAWEALDWSGALPASEAELARGERAQAALNALARANGWEEQRAFDYPPQTLHTVAAGESIYSVARLYDASVAEIILANLGETPLRLYAGTVLVVPNPGSGFAGAGDVPLDATLGD